MKIQWYEVREGDETAHIRASSTRAALGKGFTATCGSRYILPPTGRMTIGIRRIPGNSELFRFLENNYQRVLSQQ